MTQNSTQPNRDLPKDYEECSSKIQNINQLNIVTGLVEFRGNKVRV